MNNYLRINSPARAGLMFFIALDKWAIVSIILMIIRGMKFKYFLEFEQV